MDLRQLRYFIALHEQRSFVRAADIIGITQPAFSRSIQSLEQELGCTLVDRASKDLRPTPEGYVVLQHALNLVKGAALLSSEVAQMNKLDAGELRLGCAPSCAARWVPDAVAAFLKAYPRVRVSVEVHNWERLGRQLNREEIEFFVGDVCAFDADTNVQIQLLKPRPLVLFCRAQHPLLATPKVSSQDLFDYPLAASVMTPQVRKLLAGLSGQSDFRPAVETNDLAMLSAIVQQSNAIGIVNEEAFQTHIATGVLACLPARSLPQDLAHLSARCGIVSRAGYRLSPAAKAMIQVLVELDG